MDAELKPTGAPSSFIKASRDDYEGLPAYMKSLTSWEVWTFSYFVSANAVWLLHDKLTTELIQARLLSILLHRNCTELSGAFPFSVCKF